MSNTKAAQRRRTAWIVDHGVQSADQNSHSMRAERRSRRSSPPGFSRTCRSACTTPSGGEARRGWPGRPAQDAGCGPAPAAARAGQRDSVERGQAEAGRAIRWMDQGHDLVLLEEIEVGRDPGNGTLAAGCRLERRDLVRRTGHDQDVPQPVRIRQRQRVHAARHGFQGPPAFGGCRATPCVFLPSAHKSSNRAGFSPVIFARRR
jgi:hypothetical protein